MFEHNRAKLASQKEFRGRIIKFSFLSMLIFIVSLSIGVLGYYFIGKLKLVDAFMNASMILGGMGPVDTLPSPEAKIFAGCYALFSGIAFLLGMGVVIAPVVHRFYHKFHLNIGDKNDK